MIELAAINSLTKNLGGSGYDKGNGDTLTPSQ